MLDISSPSLRNLTIKILRYTAMGKVELLIFKTIFLKYAILILSKRLIMFLFLILPYFPNHKASQLRLCHFVNRAVKLLDNVLIGLVDILFLYKNRINLTAILDFA